MVSSVGRDIRVVKKGDFSFLPPISTSSRRRKYGNCLTLFESQMLITSIVRPYSAVAALSGHIPLIFITFATLLNSRLPFTTKILQKVSTRESRKLHHEKQMKT